MSKEEQLAKAGDFDRAQLDTIRNVICPGITDNELKLFSEVCRQTKLSPFAKQIYVTKRATWDAELKQSVPKMTIQTGIDGFRLIAERTGKYRGQTAFQWCGEDGAWRDVWLSSKPPAAARAGVIRSDFAEPLYRTARWAAYVQTKRDGSPTQMWAKMGPEQLAKCAEALALRTAFPQELSGLYTEDEMHQADNEPSRTAEVRATVVEPPPATSTKQLTAANDPAFPEEKHLRVWALYKNSSVVGHPITSIPDDKLASYIERLEKTAADRRNEKTNATADEAQWYLVAAREERNERERIKRELEAESTGADPETGELPPPSEEEFRTAAGDAT